MNRELTQFRFTALVVTGNARVRENTLRALAGREARALSAATAAEALGVFIRERPHLLVIDLEPPAGASAELLARARALEPGVAAFAFGRFGSPEERTRAIEELDLLGVHDLRDDESRLVELIASAVASRRAHERSGTSRELRDLIVAKLCHDLRTALHVVQGYSEILRTDSPPGMPEDILRRLGDASDTALELVQNYLDLARLESPAAAVRREPVDLDPLIDELRAGAARQIGDRQVRFTASLPRSGARLETDGEKLRAILVQLLANAIKFTPAGEVHLAVRFARQHTEFVLSDGGAGLRQDDTDVLSRPFCQVRDSLLSSTPGQGIGLAIAVRLATIIGASLAVAAGRSSGAVFTLRLPVAAGAAGSPAERPILH